MAKTDTKVVKNVSGATLTLMGYGVVEPNGTIEVAADFNNANFEEVKSPRPSTIMAPKKDEEDAKAD